METKETKALAKPYDIVTNVATKVRGYVEKRELMLPADYSAENALKSAWLILQETVDKDKRPVLETCSQASIANSLLDMIIQGLNPTKKQCYFIAYGTRLSCQRSYFGTMAVAQRVANTKLPWAEVVYQDDKFEYTLSHGKKTITKHTQKVGNIKEGEIIAAYCVIDFQSPNPSYTEIMTMEQIRKAWSKSKMNPDAPTSTHAMFAEEMCKRTVINRACKKLINSSSDNNLFLESFHRADEEQAEADMAAEIAEKANKEIIGIDMATGEIIVDKAIEPEVVPIPEKPETEKAIGVATPIGAKAQKAKAEAQKPKRDVSKILTIADMRLACFQDFNMQPKEIYAELNISGENEITQSPQDCYRQIAAVRMPKEQKAGPEF